MNNKLDEILKGVDKNQLRKLAASPLGKNIAGKLTDADKQKLLREFNNLDPNKVREKLNEINSGKISGINTDELIKKLKK